MKTDLSYPESSRDAAKYIPILKSRENFSVRASPGDPAALLAGFRVGGIVAPNCLYPGKDLLCQSITVARNR